MMPNQLNHNNQDTKCNLEFKNTITELKSSNDGLKIGMERIKERIIELEGRTIEMIQIEQQREKTLEVDCRTIQNRQHFYYCSPRRRGYRQ